MAGFGDKFKVDDAVRMRLDVVVPDTDDVVNKKLGDIILSLSAIINEVLDISKLINEKKDGKK